MLGITRKASRRASLTVSGGNVIWSLHGISGLTQSIAFVRGQVIVLYPISGALSCIVARQCSGLLLSPRCPRLTGQQFSGLSLFSACEAKLTA